MSAVQFYLPYDIAIKPTNIGAPGAKLYVYAYNTTTLRPVYSTSALTTQLTNPVIADGAGKFPAIYLDNSLSYKIVITDKLGATLYTRNPYIPGAAPDASALAPYQAAAEAAATTASGAVTTATTQAATATTQAGIATAAATTATTQAGIATSAATTATTQAGLATTAGALASTSYNAIAAAIALGTLNNATLNASTRVILKGLNTALSLPAYHDGSTWELAAYSAVSALVTADTAEGLYARSSSDTSKVWVRKFGGPALSTWFGVSTSGTAAANGAAMDAAFATLKALRLASGYGYSVASIGLHTPVGVYAFDRTLAPQSGMALTGDSSFMGSGTVFTFPAGTRGIYIQGWDGTDRHAVGSRVSGIHCRGTFSGSNSPTAVGIEVNGIASVENCFVENFDGDGYYAWGSTGTTQGNANGAFFRNITAQGCRHGFYSDNADGNAMVVINAFMNSNRQCGAYDSSFLGCSFWGGDMATNGLVTGFATRCVYSGNIYSVKQGQEVGASTNAPSGTTANNTWWQYMRAGTAAAYQPTWTSGLTWYFSAPFCNDNANQCSVFDGIYVEVDGNPCWLTGSAIVTGGSVGVPVYSLISGAAYGGWMRGNDSSMRFGQSVRVDGGVIALGQTNQIGPNTTYSSATSDGELQIHNTNVNSALSFYSSGVKKAQVLNNNTDLYYDAASHNFRSASGTGWGTWNASGIVVKLGYLGYTTGAGGAVTQAASRTTGVTLNKAAGQITLVSAAGSATWQTFTVTNSTVAATDTIRVCQSSGTDLNMIHVTNVAAGSFKISFATTGGTTTEQPVFNFAVIKGANS